MAAMKINVSTKQKETKIHFFPEILSYANQWFKKLENGEETPLFVFVPEINSDRCIIYNTKTGEVCISCDCDISGWKGNKKYSFKKIDVEVSMDIKILS